MAKAKPKPCKPSKPSKPSAPAKGKFTPFKVGDKGK